MIMKLHLCQTKKKILIQHQSKNTPLIEHDVTYDSLLLSGAFISMFHEGAVTINGQDGEPIFDIQVSYHQKK